MMTLINTNILIGPSYPNISVNNPNTMKLPIAKVAALPNQAQTKLSP